MPTTALSGKTGNVTGAGGTGSVGTEITQWDASVEFELLDGTSFDSAGWEESVQGLSRASGSFTAIGTPPAFGSIATLTLQTSTTSGSLELTGAAYLNNVATSTPVDGRVEYSADFKYTGAVTIGTVT